MINSAKELMVRSRRTPWLVTGLALTVLAGVVAFSTVQVRHRIRQQIASRDAELLYATALHLYDQDRAEGNADSIADPGVQMSLALRCAQLRGVLGVRLFDAQGRFVESFLPDLPERSLAPELLPDLRQLHPVSRFLAHEAESEISYLAEGTHEDGSLPVLEINVPLHEPNGPLAGIAQFLLEGNSIAAEYANLDRRLALQGLTTFGAGGAILTAALLWAFARLRRAQRLLAQRAEDLVKANQELALAAKTSALGAVAGHLIHGLKNPLAGLHSFVASREPASEASEAADWQQAVASTRRMQTMIQQVVSVLQEEHGGARYEVALTELEEIVRGRVQPLAREQGVNFTSVIQATAALPNRTANLLVLVLVNLLENAIHATPHGKCVALAINRADQRLVFEVRDEGPGFPADTPLFMPCRSSKEGGTGIGLALCKQLANHLGAELELASSTPSGCVFALRLDPHDKTATATARLPRSEDAAE